MTSPTQPSASIDTSKAAAVPCLVIDGHQIMSTLSLGLLMQIVPDPRKLEDKKLQPSLFANPALADLADKRETIQRYFTGAKKTNLPKYAEFIQERVLESPHRGTPPICLGTTTKLQVITPGDGTGVVGIPYNRFFLAVDGETQRGAWEIAYNQIYQRVLAGLTEEEVLDSVRVPVEIHHGLSVDALQALFYERNVLGAKVNANEAIAKDKRDPATRIVRRVMEQPLEMPWGKVVPTGVIVQEASRQVGKKSEHWVTLSALRTLVVTTMLGRAGLQYGAKPVSLPDGTDHETVEAEVTTLVHNILQRYSKHFHAKEATLIGSPAIMAGIGVVAHRTIHTLPSNSDKPALTVEELFELLDPVRWDREERWDGVATRKTPSGVTTVAGPKEVGYAAAAALEFSDKKSGAQIRNLPIPEEPQSAIPVADDAQSAIPVAGFQQPAMQPTFG